MRDASLLQLASSEHEQRYRVCLLGLPEASSLGIRHFDDLGTQFLEWGQVQNALAGEVGEPEGVRTVVFDLVTDRIDAPDGPRFSVCRLDAEPGEDAMKLAQAIATAVGDRASASIKSLAAEGSPSLWFPDIEEFEASAVQSLTE